MLLAIGIIMSLITLLSDVYQVRLLTAIMNYEYDYLTASSLFQAHEFWQSIITVIGFGVGILTMCIFLDWFYRAYRNLPSLGAKGLKFKPKWVIAYFFIPILSVWKPFTALQEIWSESTYDSSGSTKITYILLIWWILFVISNIIGYSKVSGYLNAATFEELKNLINRDMVLQILFIGSNMYLSSLQMRYAIDRK
jgi:hypothetical protein